MAPEGKSMKRYFLFAGSTYYPKSGMGDFVNSFDKVSDAIYAAANLASCDWWEVYDTIDVQPELISHGSR